MRRQQNLKEGKKRNSPRRIQPGAHPPTCPTPLLQKFRISFLHTRFLMPPKSLFLIRLNEQIHEKQILPNFFTVSSFLSLVLGFDEEEEEEEEEEEGAPGCLTMTFRVQ